MAEFKKYQRNPTIVGALEIDTPADYGDLGSLTCGDYIIYLANGGVHTLDATSVACNYTQTTDTATLTGDNWD